MEFYRKVAFQQFQIFRVVMYRKSIFLTTLQCTDLKCTPPTHGQNIAKLCLHEWEGESEEKLIQSNVSLFI